MGLIVVVVGSVGGGCIKQLPDQLLTIIYKRPSTSVILLTCRFSDHCPNTVMETSPTQDKEEIQVLWTAPAAGSGCVNFQESFILRY